MRNFSDAIEKMGPSLFPSSKLVIPSFAHVPKQAPNGVALFESNGILKV